LTIKQHIDREDIAEVTFTVEVKDKGSPEEKVMSEVRLVIDDENDNAPEFSEAIYYGSVLEDDKKPHRRQAVLMVNVNSIRSYCNGQITSEKRISLAYYMAGNDKSLQAVIIRDVYTAPKNKIRTPSDHRRVWIHRIPDSTDSNPFQSIMN
jgi:hypothetical protein